MSMSRLRTALCTALAVMIPATVTAQATPPKKAMGEMGEHHMSGSGWKELDSFHMILAATWHPIEKSNDLKPIREKATSLSDAAKAWAASKVPAACDTTPIRDAIAAVVTKSKDVAQLVAKQAPDADVKAALHDVHERFEAVEEGCKPAKK